MPFMNRDKVQMPSRDSALPGRQEKMAISGVHVVLGTPLVHDIDGGDDSLEVMFFAMGCFWGAERRFWQLEDVYSTAVGYAGGYTPNPTYQEVCSGMTGHTEVVQVVFHPRNDMVARLLAVFWEAHDPTQGYRQGNDVGTQYRSAIYCTKKAQLEIAETTRDKYQLALTSSGLGQITTELKLHNEFYFAEDYHQQYLAKNPNGYCGLKGTGVELTGQTQ
jgi:peptide-methionine (S)-S-oxide reductase